MPASRSLSAKAALLSIPAALAAAVSGVAGPKPDAAKPDAAKPAAAVYVRATPLTAADALADGLGGGDAGTPIETEPGTVLIWIDRGPGGRFDHPTEYVLVSPTGTRVVSGRRRPLLNGRPAFDAETAAAAQVPAAAAD